MQFQAVRFAWLKSDTSKGYFFSIIRIIYKKAKYYFTFYNMGMTIRSFLGTRI